MFLKHRYKKTNKQTKKNRRKTAGINITAVKHLRGQNFVTDSPTVVLKGDRTSAEVICL